MAETRFSVRLPEAVQDLLGSLSKSTNRSKNVLVREAIIQFVESEAYLLEGIQRGMADVEAGRVVSHDEALRQVRKTLARFSGDAKPQ